MSLFMIFIFTVVFHRKHQFLRFEFRWEEEMTENNTDELILILNITNTLVNTLRFLKYDLKRHINAAF